jgi:hypothetical protein
VRKITLVKKIKPCWLPFLLFGLTSFILVGCDNKPTATLKVTINLGDCTSVYTTSVRSNGEPITTPAQLRGANDETQSAFDCGISEIEYAFNTDPLASKIELDLGADAEITGMVSLDDTVSSPPPFVIAVPQFQSISVEVTFPDAKVAPLRGSVQARNN